MLPYLCQIFEHVGHSKQCSLIRVYTVCHSITTRSCQTNFVKFYLNHRAESCGAIFLPCVFNLNSLAIGLLDKAMYHTSNG